ncbi:MAG: hypothetical protein WCL16_02825, partial [bacterium]
MKDVDCLRAAALFSLSLLMTSATQAADYVITLPELLNHHWQHELVTYPFSADKDACATNSVQLTGPGGRLPVQLAGVELWPGTTSVKSAALAFVVEDLPALATQSFTVAYGPAPVAKAVGMPDLTVKRGADRVEATTSRFGVRLLLGEKAFDPAVAASNVPGPVLAMRLADGTWFGGSRLYGNTPIAGYSARLTEAGPVLLRVECLYRYADGRTNAITMQLNAQGNRVYYITHVPRGQPQDGWEISLSGLPPLAFQFMPEQVSLQPRTHAIKGWKEREIADYPAGLISNLTPWGDWVDEFTQTTLFLAFLDKRPASKSAGLMDSVKDPETAVDLDGAPASEPDGRELVIRRLDAGAWVTPGSGVSREQAQVPLIKAEDGTLSLRISNKAGARQWTIGENPYYLAKLVKVQNPTSTMQDDLEDLNVIKDMVLDWPATGPKHPSLLLDANDFAKAGERNPVALKRLQDAKTLRSDLGSYVFFDSMRHAAAVICQYDALIDSSLIAPQERRVLRAQMAYLAYRLASPANWSTAHGYNSGNPNMTVAHLVNQGLAASVLSDHPMAKEWVALPMASMNGWLDGIDDAGHWPESSHYARVSESKMVYFSIATHRAGLYPFLDDPRFKRMVLYYERTMTPPDPQRPMGPPGKQLLPRVTPPYGRGGNGESEGLGGMVAKATEKLDPGFSRILQWSYAGSQFSTQFGEDMFGYDQLMTDPALPKEQPDWRSELLPRVGALFRSGLGLPEENYLLMISKYATNPDGEIWPSETGAITTWFDHGKPLTRVFPAGSNYGYLNGLLLNRVMLATRYQRGKRVAGGY